MDRKQKANSIWMRVYASKETKPVPIHAASIEPLLPLPPPPHPPCTNSHVWIVLQASAPTTMTVQRKTFFFSSGATLISSGEDASCSSFCLHLPIHLSLPSSYSHQYPCALSLIYFFPFQHVCGLLHLLWDPHDVFEAAGQTL